MRNVCLVISLWKRQKHAKAACVWKQFFGYLHSALRSGGSRALYAQHWQQQQQQQRQQQQQKQQQQHRQQQQQRQQTQTQTQTAGPSMTATLEKAAAWLICLAWQVYSQLNASGCLVSNQSFPLILTTPGKLCFRNRWNLFGTMGVQGEIKHQEQCHHHRDRFESPTYSYRVSFCYSPRIKNDDAIVVDWCWLYNWRYMSVLIIHRISRIHPLFGDQNPSNQG